MIFYDKKTFRQQKKNKLIMHHILLNKKQKGNVPYFTCFFVIIVLLLVSSLKLSIKIFKKWFYHKRSDFYIFHFIIWSHYLQHYLKVNQGLIL